MDILHDLPPSIQNDFLMYCSRRQPITEELLQFLPDASPVHFAPQLPLDKRALLAFLRNHGSELRVLDLSNIASPPSYNGLLEQLRLYCPRLHTLSLSGQGWRIKTSGMVSLCRGLPHIAELILDRTNINDSGVAALHKLTSLRTLSLSRCTALTREGYAAVFTLSTLTSLTLRRTNLRKRVPPSPKLPNLTSLDIGQSEVRDSDVRRLLSTSTALTSLNVFLTHVGDKTLSALPTLTPHLTSLDMALTNATAKGIATHFTRLSRLALLNISLASRANQAAIRAVVSRMNSLQCLVHHGIEHAIAVTNTDEPARPLVLGLPSRLLLPKLIDTLASYAEARSTPLEVLRWVVEYLRLATVAKVPTTYPSIGRTQLIVVPRLHSTNETAQQAILRRKLQTIQRKRRRPVLAVLSAPNTAHKQLGKLFTVAELPDAGRRHCRFVRTGRRARTCATARLAAVRSGGHVGSLNSQREGRQLLTDLLWLVWNLTLRNDYHRTVLRHHGGMAVLLELLEADVGSSSLQAGLPLIGYVPPKAAELAVALLTKMLLDLPNHNAGNVCSRGAAAVVGLLQARMHITAIPDRFVFWLLRFLELAATKQPAKVARVLAEVNGPACVARLLRQMLPAKPLSPAHDYFPIDDRSFRYIAACVNILTCFAAESPHDEEAVLIESFLEHNTVGVLFDVLQIYSNVYYVFRYKMAMYVAARALLLLAIHGAPAQGGDAAHALQLGFTKEVSRIGFVVYNFWLPRVNGRSYLLSEIRAAWNDICRAAQEDPTCSENMDMALYI